MGSSVTESQHLVNVMMMFSSVGCAIEECCDVSDILWSVSQTVPIYYHGLLTHANAIFMTRRAFIAQVS